jgi:hypothetical protein
MASKTKAKANRHRTPQAPRYTRRAKPLRLGTSMRVVARRDRRHLPAFVMDELVEHVNWERADSDMTGEVNFRRPLGSRGVEVLLSSDMVELWIAPTFGSRDLRWERLWRMKVATPRHQIKEGVLSVALKASLSHWDDEQVAWKVKAGRKAHQVARIAAARFKMPVGRLAVGKHKLPKKIVKKGSVKKIVTWAYGEERTETGRRFDITTRRGVLEVLELRYPKYALELGDAILDAELAHSISDVASVVVVTSSSRKRGSRKSKKLKVRVTDRARLKRYGRIEKTVEKSGLKTRAAMRRYGRKYLARHRRVVKEIAFTHPGIPHLDRADACRVRLTEDNVYLVGFVKSVRHTASAGSYEVDVTVNIDDPYVDKKKAKTKKKRAAAAKKRGRKTTDTTTSPKPKRAARH